MSHADVVLNGLKHRIWLWGRKNRPKLFLVHGWMDTGASFHFLAERLKDRYRCIAPDLRGCGRSAHAKGPLGYHFHEYMADLHALFSRFAPDEPLRVLGHSMGGNLLALYAGTFPERVRHFINVEGFGIHDRKPEAGPPRMRQWLEGLSERRRFKVYPNLRALAERLVKANPRLPEERALFLAKRLSVRVAGGRRIAADPRHKAETPFLFRLENAAAFWKNIGARCLLVTGERTEMNVWLDGPEGFEKELARRLDLFPAAAQRLVIGDSGHMVHHEKPEALAAAAAKFME